MLLQKEYLLMQVLLSAQWYGSASNESQDITERNRNFQRQWKQMNPQIWLYQELSTYIYDD